MVFGWGKKKEKKFEEAEPISVEKQISLSEVTKITKEIKSLRNKTLVSEAKSFKNKIDSQNNELLKIAKKLEKDSLKIDDIDKNLRTIVVRGKNQVISTILKEASFNFKKINSVDDVLQYDKEVSQVLKKIGDTLGRQTRVIHLFAKKYAEKLKTILTTMDAVAKDLHIVLENYQKLENEIVSISNNLAQINQITNEQETRKKRLIELNDEHNSIDEKIKSLSKEIENLMNSNEYVKFQEIKKNIDNLQSEKALIKDDIDQQFTKLSRPLTKYSYVSSLDKPQKILLDRLLQNPSDVLTADNKKDIMVILQATRKGIQSNTVSVKDTDKSVFYIDETTEMLDSFINKISEHNSKKSVLENELGIFNIDEFERKLQELSKTKNDKKDLESKIHSFENEIADSRSQIPDIIKDIENKLREISSTKYSITKQM